MKHLNAFILILIMACENKHDNFSIRIAEVYHTNAVSSGSGIAVEKDSVIIVGDDVNYLTAINILNRGSRNILFDSNATTERIPKSMKHDLESCTLAEINNQSYLLAFGSGGISPQRDSLFGLNRTNEGQNFKISLVRLYDSISKEAGLKKAELNIEGAAIAGKNLLLFNRGKNFIAVIPWHEMAAYILQPEKADIPSFKILQVQLPVINNFPVGFSGACTIDENYILFTASLEETTDYIQDGAVKGSYIGTIELKKDNAVIKNLVQLRDDNGNIVLDKLESIEIYEKTTSTLKAIAVADNDDGTSKIFKMLINL